MIHYLSFKHLGADIFKCFMLTKAAFSSSKIHSSFEIVLNFKTTINILNLFV